MRMLLCSILTLASTLGVFAHPASADKSSERSLLLPPKPSNASLILPLGVSGFGCIPTAYSEERTSDRNWFNTALQVLENIYDTRPNGSEIAAHYEWVLNPGGTSPINITAVRRGLEEGLPIAFTNRAMVQFIRNFAQSVRSPWAWVEFECSYSWDEPGKGRTRDLVAKGKFTPLTGYSEEGQ